MISQEVCICTLKGRASDSMMSPTYSYLFQMVGAGAFLSVARPTI